MTKGWAKMSIRGRLTLWFTCLFGVIVVALAVGSYSVVRKQAYSKLDTSLRIATGAAAMSAEHEMNEHEEAVQGESDLQSVLDETASPDLVDTQILVKEGSRIAAFKSGRHGTDLRRVDLAGVGGTAETRGDLRVGSLPLFIAKFQARYVIYAGRPVASAAAQVEQIRWLLCLLVPVGLALAGAAGFVLASRALKPLQDFALVVDAITSSDLTARVRPGAYGDEISNLGLRFNALLERLEHAFMLQRRFMADASHQIRTPVTVALTAAQVVTRDADASFKDHQEALQTIERQMLRLRRIVEDMFFLSQTDTVPLQIPAEDIYLDDAIAEAARAAVALCREKGQELRIAGLPEARCRGDMDLLAQAVLVLLDNAIKFTPAGGQISVELVRRGAEWVCSVADTGTGIPEDFQGRVFERFFQVNQRDREQRKGAGLGLSIAQSIVESHGGRLALVESRFGRTVFEICIPAAGEPVPEEITDLEAGQPNSPAVRI